MAITMEHGHFSGDVLNVLPEKVDDLEDIIVDLLLAQRRSWEDHYTLEQILDAIRKGMMFCFIHVDKNKVNSLMLWFLKRNNHGELVAVIEMITCREFYRIIQFYDQLESYFLRLGVSEVTANANSVLAKYMVKKLGYTSPAVVVRKKLRRVN